MRRYDEESMIARAARDRSPVARTHRRPRVQRAASALRRLCAGRDGLWLTAALLKLGFGVFQDVSVAMSSWEVLR